MSTLYIPPKTIPQKAMDLAEEASESGWSMEIVLKRWPHTAHYISSEAKPAHKDKT